MQLLNASQIKFAAPLQRLWRNRSKLNKLPRKWFNYVSVPERVLLPNTDNYGTELRPQIDMEDTIRIFIMFLVSDGDFCQTLAVPYFKRSVWWCYTSHARRPEATYQFGRNEKIREWKNGRFCGGTKLPSCCAVCCSQWVHYHYSLQRFRSHLLQ